MLIFVADISDVSDSTRDLFRQLYHAPWARDTRIFLALSKIDVLEQRLDEDSLSLELRNRTAEYLASVRGPVAIHSLNILDERQARTLISEAVDACAEFVDDGPMPARNESITTHYCGSCRLLQ